MPYPSEHSARITSPDQYERFARKNIAPGIDAILGIDKEGKSEIQAYRFDVKKFTEDEAKEWLKEHDIKYILFEPAQEEEKSAMKIGARNSAKDKERITKIKESARVIIDTADELQPEEPLLELVKGNLSMKLPEFHVIGETLVKAAGDMELDVLLVPFGGPDNGKDTDGQFFSPDTQTQHEIYKTIPAYYYHGFTPDGDPQGDPEVIGMMHYDHTDEKGHWYRAVLDKTNQYAKRIWEAAKKGLARASSGTIAHIARAARGGFIRKWPVVERSLIDEGENRHPANAYAVALPVLKARQPDLVIPGDDESTEADDTALIDNATIEPKTNLTGEIKMEEKDILKMVADEIAKLEATKAEEAKKAAERQAEIDKAVKAKEEELEKKFAESNRLPSDRAPYAKKFGDTDQFDNLDAGDLATVIGVVKSAGQKPSEAAYKALAFKLEEDKSGIGESARKSMKNIKANELDYSTLSSYGDEWAGVAYSQAIWESIRTGASIINKIPSVEFPKGVESMYLPLEGTDPVWYKVAEATSSATGYAGPTPTVTASQLGTGRVPLTLAKLGARVLWTGELDESSLVPFAGQLRAQLGASGLDYLESAIIDGDTETGASTNINNIAGTPAATDWFMVFDGFRKSPLITTTANSRSAAGSLDVSDYLETIKLMGTAGINGLDRARVEFIVDPNTYYKTIGLHEVLTRDVFVSPTLEGGQLSGLFGYKLNVSGNMHKASTSRKAKSDGKIDVDTQTNNAYGAILAVRFDQWKLGWMRHIKLETARWAASDTNEIVATMRVGLKQRDTEASAITYYVGV